MIQNELGVVDNAHRKKLELRAMDVVLFGPPRGIHYNDIIHYVVPYGTYMHTV